MMRRLAPLRSAVAGLALALPAAGAAQTVRVDFREFTSPTAREYQATVGLPVTSGGFDFYETSLYNGSNSRNVLGTWGTADRTTVNRPTNVGASNTLFATSTAGLEIDMFAAGSNLITNTYTNVFTMRSIDVAHLYSTEFSSFTPGPISLTFFGFGTGTGGATIQQTFTIPVPPLVGSFRYPALTTLTFDSRWTNLYNVWWFQSTGSGTAHQFTNVVATLGVVPEPGTYLLVAVGIGGVALVARRRRDATT